MSARDALRKLRKKTDNTKKAVITAFFVDAANGKRSYACQFSLSSAFVSFNFCFSFFLQLQKCFTSITCKNTRAHTVTTHRPFIENSPPAQRHVASVSYKKHFVSDFSFSTLILSFPPFFHSICARASLYSGVFFAFAVKI